MIKTPSFSIIVPYYNNSGTIVETLNSILEQSVPADEIIIINDGSEKSEYNFLLSIIKGQKVKLINQSNKGPSSARNVGIANSSKDYIVFLDSDDLMVRNSLEVIKQSIIKNPTADVFVPRVQLFGNKTEIKNTFIPEINQILKSNPLTITVCCKKSLLSKEYLFKSELNQLGLEDWEWWINIISSGFNIITIPQILFKIRVTNSSRTYKTANKKLVEAKNAIFCIHGSLLHEKYNNLYLENKSLKQFIYFRLRKKLKKIFYGR